MTNPELIRIMNEKLDGIASPEDSERLRLALETSGEARDAYRKLGGVFQALEQVPMVEPPPDLKVNVVRAIRGLQSVPVRSGWLESFRAAFRKRPAFRLAYTFAAGAACGVIALVLLRGDFSGSTRPSSSVTSGAMMPPDAGRMTPVDRRELHWASGTVTARTLESAGGLVAQIECAAPVGTQIVLDYGPSFSAAGLRQEKGAANDVSIVPGRLSIRVLGAGESGYLLYLTPQAGAASSVRIDVRTAGGALGGALRTQAAR